MKDEILYMLGVLATVFAVNYTLRALPFILFHRRDQELPKWVAQFGRIISPIIFGGLIIYCYAGLQWRSPWPYIAGFVTIALQVWKHNALASIVTGTILYMILINCCGCSTVHRSIQVDAREPSLRVTTKGVMLGNEYVDPYEVADILEDFDIPYDRTIHIRIDNDVTDLMPSRTLMGLLAKAGYTSPVLVTKRHAESRALGDMKKQEKVIRRR